MKTKITVWDIPTRLFHWSLVCLMAALWWTADQGEMEWHQICAYALMVLIVFRWVWGVIGSDTAKFTDFMTLPSTAWRYLRGQYKAKTLGHNPLGGYMVMAFMLCLSLQLITGLFATDDIFTEGPLYQYVSSDMASTLTWLHKLNFEIILYMVAIHVLAVIVHQLKGENLIVAMVTGNKKAEQGVVGPSIAASWKAVLIISALGAIVWYMLIAPIVAFL
ncbi:cytochrome b/b6 domain-containing protein [Shewanella maritima]|uniref:cytochrome b/b6 domain-containing protein n=1 Tax=Shewanella maritima TaxID=2520507 RepID=UPI00373549FD